MFIDRLLNQGSEPLYSRQTLRFTAARHKLIAENVVNNIQHAGVSAKGFVAGEVSKPAGRPCSGKRTTVFPATFLLMTSGWTCKTAARGILFHDGQRIARWSN